MNTRTDVYVRFTNNPVARARRIGMTDQEVNLDLDSAGRPVGVEILAASGVEVNGADVPGVDVAEEPLHEWRCPGCGATTRARMADAPPAAQERPPVTAAESAAPVTYTITAYLIERPEQVDAADLPAPYRARLNEVADQPDTYACWECRAAIGWVLNDDGPVGRLDWETVALTSTGDVVAALCEGCAPDLPAAPYAGDPEASPACADAKDAEIAELLAEVARLHEVAANAHAAALVQQTALRGMTVEEGAAVLELAPPRALVIAWVHAAREMLGGAENYSETRIDFPSASMEVKAAGEYEWYVFTVQRAGRVTPHEARRNAEAEVERLRALLAEHSIDDSERAR